jgi:hypothetical protein
MIDAKKGKVGVEDFEEFEKKGRRDEYAGFCLIRDFVEKYPTTEYPSVDDDLMELFMNGARKLGFKYIICVGDDTHCPHCKETTGKVEKKGLALDVVMGHDSTICNYCWVEEWQDREWDTPETCKHSKYDKSKEWLKNCEEWHYEDCMGVLEAYEHSYNIVLKDEGMI